LPGYHPETCTAKCCHASVTRFIKRLVVKLPDSVVMNHFYEHLGLDAEELKEIEEILKG